MTLTPRSYQIKGSDWLYDIQRGILADDPGTGKTLQAVRAAPTPALIVCPAPAKYVWKEHIEQQYPDADVQVISTPNTPFLPVPYWIINYDIAIRYTQQIKRPMTLIVDEAHRIKSGGARQKNAKTGVVSYGAKRAKWVAAAAKGVEYVFFLTGTPMTARPIDLWFLLKTLDVTKMSRREWALHFCDGKHTHWGFDVSGASNLDELSELLSTCMLRRTKAQVLSELPPKVRSVVALDHKQPAQFKGLTLKDLTAHFEHKIYIEGLADLLQTAARMKLPQAMQFIDGLLEETHKVVVFYWHRSVGDDLENRMKRYGVVRIDGRTSAGAIAQAKHQFQKQHGTRVMLAQVLSGGEIHTFTAASHTVFVEAAWNSTQLIQAEDRTHRIGTDLGLDSVNYYYLVSARSIDEYMLRRCLEKQAIIDQVVKETKMSEEENEVMQVQLDETTQKVLIKGAKALADMAKSLTNLAALASPPALSEAEKQTVRDQGGVPLGDEEEEEEEPPPPPKTRKKRTVKKKAATKKDNGTGPSRDEVFNEFKSYLDKHGDDAVIALLEEFEAENFSGIPKEKYADVMARMKDASTGDGDDLLA